MIECCVTCDYWDEKYQQCEHPSQTAVGADAYISPPEKMCELYYPNTTKPPPGGDGWKEIYY